MTILSKRMEIVNELGLHTRAATLLVKKASEFSSNIEFIHEDMRANAKSIMGLLALGARKGALIEVCVTGQDQEEALQCMVQLVASGFYEGQA